MKKLHLSLLAVIASGSVLALPSFNPIHSSLHRNKLGAFFDCQDEKLDCCNPVAVKSLCDLDSTCWDESMTNIFSLSVGYYGDFVFDRKLNVEDRIQENNLHPTIHRASLYTNGALVTVSFMDAFSVYGSLGATNFKASWTSNSLLFDKPSTFVGDLNTNSKFSWLIGGNAIFWKGGCLAIGANGQLFRAKPTVESSIEQEGNAVGGSVIKFPTTPTPVFYYREGQVSLGMSAWFHSSATGTTALVPYANIKWAHVHSKFYGIAAPLTSTTNRFGYGYSLGLTYVADQRASITVEGRWMDEKAMHLNGQLRF